MLKINNILLLLIIVIFTFLLTYRILEVPMGITADEDAFGYNAVLLSRTAHDENGRFLPIFVLSNNGNDWKQPITQYYLTVLYLLFQPSVFLLRFSSVLITLLSAFLIYKLSAEVFNNRIAIITVLVFLTTPLIMIHSHMGLDNIMPIPFAIIWLYSLIIYKKNKQTKYLIISAMSLGINFYTYKGMRAVFPIWYLLSLLFLLETPIKKCLRCFFVFSLYSLPFFLVTPVLNHLYPGAIFGGARPYFEDIYTLLYPYLSSFDLTFLFIKGDDLLIHSTGRHGFFLLASLPLFLTGIYHSLRTNKLSRFILIIFFTTPLLYGTINSVHRASRLMSLIPFYSIICTYGFMYFLKLKIKYKNIVIGLFFFLSFFNYVDFLNYYYYDYSKLTQAVVGDLKTYQSFKTLKDTSIKLGLNPYVSSDISNKFYEAIYFKNNLIHIHQDFVPPPGSILLTNRNEIDGMTKLNDNMKYYHLQIRK